MLGCAGSPPISMVDVMDLNIVIAFVMNTHFSPLTEIDDLESKANESNI